MCADGHHAPALTRFRVERLELSFQVVSIHRCAEVPSLVVNYVIHVKRIWHDCEWLVVHGHEERFIAADIVNVINESKRLRRSPRYALFPAARMR